MKMVLTIKWYVSTWGLVWRYQFGSILVGLVVWVTRNGLEGKQVWGAFQGWSWGVMNERVMQSENNKPLVLCLPSVIFMIIWYDICCAFVQDHYSKLVLCSQVHLVFLCCLQAGLDFSSAWFSYQAWFFLCKMFWNPKRVLKQAANLSWYCLILIVLSFSIFHSFFRFSYSFFLLFFHSPFLIQFFILFTNFVIFLSFISKLWLLFIISVNISLGCKKNL